MAKKRRESHSDPVRRKRVPRRERLTPDWLIFGLALIGVLLTGYLTFSALNETAPAFCTTGSGCDVVRNSRWSTLFGLPIALWGLGLYALLLLSAVFASPRAKSWRRLWVLSLIGVVVSIYLTLAAAIALEAFCAWCLVSLLLITAIFVITTVRRPAGAPGLEWKRFLVNNAIVLVVLLGTLHVAQAGLLTPPEDPRLAALAEHLDARGVKFYGASWCPNCQTQKDLFGRSAERLPYVECSPNGRGGAIAFACVSANIAAFPTWIIRDRPYTEVMQPEELARRSGFDWANFTPPADD